MLLSKIIYFLLNRRSVFRSCSLLPLVTLAGCALSPAVEPWRPQTPQATAYGAWIAPSPEAQDAGGAREGSGDTPRLEGTITFDRALEMALRKNFSLTEARHFLEAAEGRIRQAALLPNPELELEVENVAGSGEVSGTSAAETTLFLSQRIELGGKRRWRTLLARLERQGVEREYEGKIIALIAELRMTYIELLAAQERLTLQRELASLSAKLLEAVKERVRAGKVSPIEETRAHVVHASVLLQLERAERGFTAAKNHLATLWGETTASFERAEGAIPGIFPIPDLSSLLPRIEQNPDLLARKAEIERSRANLTLQKSFRIPDLTVGGGVRNLQESGENAFLFGIGIPLQIFDRNQGSISEAVAETSAAEAGFRALRMERLAELHEAYRNLSQAHASASRLTEEILPNAKSAFEAIQNGYSEGKFSLLDLIDAQRTLFEVRIERVEALAAFHQALAAVERLIGEEIPRSADLKKGSNR